MANRNLPPYKPIEVSFLGEQKALADKTSDHFNPARFDVVSDNLTPYQSELDDVSFWRNNLVAASKRHNYLFVAVRSTIRVYAPKYPYQTIPTSTPYITLTSAPSPGASGFIDERDPHGINSITIGDLGFEEVLVSAHDDGDVCAWYTRDLRRIAFRLSVGESAWGVALHKEQRLLAVSANTHLIQVFELAIGRNPDDEGEEEGVEGLGDERVRTPQTGSRKRRRQRHTGEEPTDGSGEEEDSPVCTSCKTHRRRKNPVKDKTVKTLIGHEHNIPNISFLDDPSGRWLVGTSIDGIVILWDVKTERIVEKCKMGYQLAGWSVLFLKPQAFKPVADLYEALGKSPLESLPTAEPCKVPITGVRTLPTDYYDPPTNRRSREARGWDISPPYFAPNTTPGGLLQLDSGYDDGDYWEEEEESLQSSEDADDAEVEVFIGPGGGHVEVMTEEGSETESTSVSTSTASSQEGETLGTYHLFAAAVHAAAHLGYSFVEGVEGVNNSIDTFGPVRIVELVQDSEGEAGEPARGSSRVHDSGQRRKADDEGHEDDECSDSDEEEKPAQPPISFIFSTTEQNCHLLTLTPSLTATVICRSALHHLNPSPSLQYLGTIDRLNMVHCIPELSLIVAASQKGRAGIFRLTRVGDTFAMRLDTVLPREDSEVGERGRERRPTAALLGVAVGPVQERRRGRGGGVGVWGRRRWRLMMVYMDGSVVSYELGREEGCGDIGGIGGGLGVGVGGFVMV